MADNVDKKVFSFVNNKPDYTGPKDVDYTGAKAKEYTDKYTDRPEDAGTLEGVQNVLSGIGVVADPADWLNAAIYASKGDLKNAALYGSGLGLLGAMKVGKKVFKYNPKLRSDKQDLSDAEFEEILDKEFMEDSMEAFGEIDEFHNILSNPSNMAKVKKIGADEVHDIALDALDKKKKEVLNAMEDTTPLSKKELKEYKDNWLWAKEEEGYRSGEYFLVKGEKADIIKHKNELKSGDIYYDFDPEYGFAGGTTTKVKDLSIEEKIMKIMKDPEKNKNFMSNMRRVAEENKKRYKK